MDSITECIEFLRIEALEILDGILESGYKGNVEDVRLWKIAEAMKKQQQRVNLERLAVDLNNFKQIQTPGRLQGEKVEQRHQCR